MAPGPPASFLLYIAESSSWSQKSQPKGMDASSLLPWPVGNTTVPQCSQTSSCWVFSVLGGRLKNAHFSVSFHHTALPGTWLLKVPFQYMMKTPLNDEKSSSYCTHLPQMFRLRTVTQNLVDNRVAIHLGFHVQTECRRIEEPFCFHHGQNIWEFVAFCPHCRY